jgi:preprotein translocase subunit SecA
MEAVVMWEVESKVSLAVLDKNWREHLQALDDLMNNLSPHMLNRRDPLAVFRAEADRHFAQMQDDIARERRSATC